MSYLFNTIPANSNESGPTDTVYLSIADSVLERKQSEEHKHIQDTQDKETKDKKEATEYADVLQFMLDTEPVSFKPQNEEDREYLLRFLSLYYKDLTHLDEHRFESSYMNPDDRTFYQYKGIELNVGRQAVDSCYSCCNTPHPREDEEWCCSPPHAYDGCLTRWSYSLRSLWCQDSLNLSFVFQKLHDILSRKPIEHLRIVPFVISHLGLGFPKGWEQDYIRMLQGTSIKSVAFGWMPKREKIYDCCYNFDDSHQKDFSNFEPSFEDLISFCKQLQNTKITELALLEDDLYRCLPSSKHEAYLTSTKGVCDQETCSWDSILCSLLCLPCFALCLTCNQNINSCCCSKKMDSLSDVTRQRLATEDMQFLVELFSCIMQFESFHANFECFLEYMARLIHAKRFERTRAHEQGQLIDLTTVAEQIRKGGKIKSLELLNFNLDCAIPQSKIDIISALLNIITLKEFNFRGFNLFGKDTNIAFATQVAEILARSPIEIIDELDINIMKPDVVSAFWETLFKEIPCKQPKSTKSLGVLPYLYYKLHQNQKLYGEKSDRYEIEAKGSLELLLGSKWLRVFGSYYWPKEFRLSYFEVLFKNPELKAVRLKYFFTVEIFDQKLPLDELNTFLVALNKSNVEYLSIYPSEIVKNFLSQELSRKQKLELLERLCIVYESIRENKSLLRIDDLKIIYANFTGVTPPAINERINTDSQSLENEPNQDLERESKEEQEDLESRPLLESDHKASQDRMPHLSDTVRTELETAGLTQKGFEICKRFSALCDIMEERIAANNDLKYARAISNQNCLPDGFRDVLQPVLQYLGYCNKTNLGWNEFLNEQRKKPEKGRSISS